MAPRPILKSPPAYSPSSSSAFRSGTNYTQDDMYDEDLFTASRRALPFASSSRIPPLESPHVHFPPTPTLTQMAITHSPYSYDRKPIEVLPNNLALPERGDREVGMGARNEAETRPTWATTAKSDLEDFDPRGYGEEMTDREPLTPPSSSLLFGTSPVGSSRNSPRMFNSYPPKLIQQTCQHSSAYAAATPTTATDGHSMLPPPLVFDQSSESDSDTCASPSLDLPPSMPEVYVHFSGLSKGPHSPSSSSTLTRKRAEGQDPLVDLGLGERHKTRRRDGVSLSRSADIAKDSTTPGFCDAFNRTRHRTRHDVSRSSVGSSFQGYPSGVREGGFSSFYEEGLEGCLGGF